MDRFLVVCIPGNGIECTYDYFFFFFSLLSSSFSKMQKNYDSREIERERERKGFLIARETMLVGT